MRFMAVATKNSPTQPDAVVEKFRLNEKPLAKKVKQYSYMAYRPDYIGKSLSERFSNEIG